MAIPLFWHIFQQAVYFLLPKAQIAQMVSGYGSLITGSWSLAAGYWPLVTGHWSLVTGRWFLVTGSWSLDTGAEFCSMPFKSKIKSIRNPQSEIRN